MQTEVALDLDRYKVWFEEHTRRPLDCEAARAQSFHLISEELLVNEIVDDVFAFVSIGGQLHVVPLDFVSNI